MKTGKINLIIDTPLGRESFYDEKSIRRAAVRYNVPCITTLSAASAAARGIRAMVESSFEINALQDLHARKATARSGLKSPARLVVILRGCDFFAFLSRTLLLSLLVSFSRDLRFFAFIAFVCHPERSRGIRSFPGFLFACHSA